MRKSIILAAMAATLSSPAYAVTLKKDTARLPDGRPWYSQ